MPLPPAAGRHARASPAVQPTGAEATNYAYFPILVARLPASRDALYQWLRDQAIYARRYFYPLITDFPMYRGMPSAAHANLPVARRAASTQVICLPIYPDLEMSRPWTPLSP